MITAAELLKLAMQVELNIAALYEDLVKHLEPGSHAAKFFSMMAAQEHIHAAWVDEMMALVTPEHELDKLSPDDFNITLTTIEDVHDEVNHHDIKLRDALEIIIHLEQSTAESFYRQFPPELPGMPAGMIMRMLESCERHAEMVQEFADSHSAE